MRKASIKKKKSGGVRSISEIGAKKKARVQIATIVKRQKKEVLIRSKKKSSIRASVCANQQHGVSKKKPSVKIIGKGIHKPRTVSKAKNMEILALKQAYGEALEKYGKLLEEQINSNRLKDKALGQFLMGLYLLGLGPDKVLAKCQQMFEPVKTEGEA